MNTEKTKPVDHRRLMKKMEAVAAAIHEAGDVSATIHNTMAEIVGSFADELGIDGGRLYERQSDAYVLRATFGEAKAVPPGLRISRDYPPVTKCLRDGVIFMRATDEGADATFEAELGVSEFAAVAVGDEQFVLGLNVAPGSHRGDISFSLGIVRHLLNDKIRRERFEDLLRQARDIQASLLPRKPPSFPPYDIAGRSVSAEGIGGDLFDFIPINDKLLGIAVADVSGHGLPAAFQVRDIYTGLRMGLARDFKVTRAIERLNRIIHGSSLTSRFVSMFYGEVEHNGNFIYVNAGHPAPMHLGANGKVTLLDQGGPVLGPLPDATYDRGFVHLRPGDLICAYTDGITEAERQGAEGAEAELGSERLLEVLRAHQGQPAEAVIEGIQKRVRSWTGGDPAGDDRTVIVVTYPKG